MKYLEKFKSKGTNLPPKTALKDVVFAFIGGFIAIAIVGYLTKEYNNLFVMGSFGASCVLLFGYPSSPFSQPRNVIVGHFISTLVGLICLHFIGDFWWSMALALAISLALMILTRTVHPPAGSNPIIVFLLGSSWDYLIFPTLVGAVILVLVALFFNNLHKNRAYPEYYF